MIHLGYKFFLLGNNWDLISALKTYSSLCNRDAILDISQLKNPQMDNKDAFNESSKNGIYPIVHKSDDDFNGKKFPIYDDAEPKSCSIF